MPATLIQSAGSATNSVAFGVNVTLGNLLVVVAGSLDAAGGVTFAVSDTQGNVYSSLALVDGNPGGGGRAQVFYCIAKATGANTVTITTASATPQIAIHEFSVVTTKDASTSATGAGAAQDSGGATTNSAAELLFGYSLHFAVAISGLVPGPGWTQAVLLGPSLTLLTEYQVVAATGTFNATSTSSGGKSFTDIWIAQIVTFSAGGGAVVHNMSMMGCGR